MNSFSHILVGKLLCAYLEKTYGIRLYRMSFLQGNFMPDFMRRFKGTPHEPAFWDKHLRNEIRSLLRLRKQETYIGRGFSRRLGYVCHFLTDFFCYPHTIAFDGGFYPHIRYEWALYTFMRRNLAELRRTDLGNDRDNRNACDACFDIEDETARVYARYKKLYEEYLELEPSYINDVLYTLSVCADAAALVARSRVAEKEPEDAGLILGAAEA